MREIARYDAMCSAIAAAYKVDEVKAIRDQAVALEAYARQAKNTENERRACEIRLRAERKAGQLEAKRQKPKGGRGKKGRPPGDPGLADLGVSKKAAKNWRKLGAVAQEAFDAALKQADKPTTNGIIKATTAPKTNPVGDDALWLWGRLKDFERDGLLAKEPSDVMATMTDRMKDDVHTLAPRVAAWLKRIGEML